MTPFAHNLQLWQRQLPPGAPTLPQRSAPLPAGKPLFNADDGQRHSVDDSPAALARHRQWLAALPQPQTQLLLLYGAAPTPALDALTVWLSDERHILVLLDDEDDAIRAFLADADAARWLSKPNFWLFYFADTAQLLALVEYLARAYSAKPYQTAASPPYAQYKARSYQHLHVSAALLWPEGCAIAQEMRTNSLGFTRNFYDNLFALPHSRDAASLQGVLKGVPAIVSGAGPSLAKNRALLKGLHHNALVIAGGTATNALGADGVIPHLNVGLDPNIFFERRIAASTAWMTPFLYSFRMNHHALQRVYGDKLLLNLPHHDGLEEWFFAKTGLPWRLLTQSHSLNVTHLCTLVALALGCNPIIFVGVDLAYTGESSYAQGIATMATHKLERDFITKHASEELLERRDIYGQPVKTLHKWIAEAVWYSKLPLLHPDITFLNATEGGLGMPTLANVTLAEAASQHCRRQECIEGLLHSAILRCPSYHGLSLGAIEEALRQLRDSFAQCRSLLDDNAATAATADDSLSLPESNTLEQEPAWRHLLREIDRFAELQLQPAYLKARSTGQDLSDIATQSHRQRRRHLAAAAQQNIDLIDKALKAPRQQPSPPATASSPPQRCHCERCQGLFEGTVSLHSGDERLLYSSFFIEGIQEEESRFYDGDGRLLQALRHCGGRGDGLQRYYYPSGRRRALIEYHDGLLHGSVEIFSEGGTSLYHGHYRNGRKEGTEHIWDQQGMLLYEASWQAGRPCGSATEWHHNGQKARHYRYDESGQLVEEQAWDNQGKPLQHPQQVHHRYLDSLLQQVALLRPALTQVKDALAYIQEAAQGTADRYGLHDSLDRIVAQQRQFDAHLSRLAQLESLLSQPLHHSSVDTAEQIAITPSLVAAVDHELKDITAALAQSLAAVERWSKLLPRR